MPAEDLVAGAAVLYPARVPGEQLVHLARTEARKRRDPALFAVCPEAPRVELERVPDPGRWWRRRRMRWCAACEAYRDHVARLPAT